MIKYFVNFFHGLIIAGFILSFNGCGYKGDPVYVPSDSKTEQSNKVIK